MVVHKTIIALNDGTDEIFNLHAFDVSLGKRQFYKRWELLFGVADVNRDAENRCLFMLTGRTINDVRGLMDKQEEHYGKTEEYLIGESEFDMSWSQAREELGW